MSVVVLLCAEGAPATEVETFSFGPDVEVHVVDDPCRDPGVIGRSVPEGAKSLVLGLCPAVVSMGAVQRRVRRLGLDPLGVEIVDLRSAAGSAARLAVLVAGAVAKARVFSRSGPEHAQLTFPSHTSRRALLTFSAPEYQAGPAVSASRCVAETGCRACVGACPTRALTVRDGRVFHDKVACEPCGRCVTACPTGAIVNPANTPAGVDALVRSLLAPDPGPPGPRGIVFTCRRSKEPETAPGWYPVVLPCTGMLPVGWIVAPLVLGAGSVAVRPCGANGCPLGHDELVEQRVDGARALLAEFAISPQRIGTAAAGVPAPALSDDGTGELRDPFGPLGAAEVVLALGRSTGGEACLERDDSPLGVVEIDANVCTGCMACTQVCPTGALRSAAEGQRSELRFDPGACVACGRCVEGCVEADRGAIGLRRLVDSARLRGGEVVAFADDVARCRACGESIAPLALLARVGEALDDETFAFIGTHCSSCRATATPPVVG